MKLKFDRKFEVYLIIKGGILHGISTDGFVSGNVYGSIFGDVKGVIAGDVYGNIFGSVTGQILGKKNSGWLYYQVY